MSVVSEEEALEVMQENEKANKVEMDDMLAYFEVPVKEGEIEEKKEEKKEEIKEVEEGKVKVEEEEKPVVPTAEKKEEEKKVEVVTDPRETQIEEMRAELVRLSSLLARDGKEQIYPVKEEVKKVEVAKEVEKEKEIKPLDSIFKNIYEKKDFLSKEQLDQLIDKPELINEALYNSRVEMADLLTEALPSLINVAVNREIIMQRTVASFYDQYQDLKPHSQYVQMVFKEIEQGNRDKTYSELFSLTATVSRKRLGLKEPSSSEVKEENAQSTQVKVKPAFAGSKAGNGVSLDKNGKKEIFDKAASDLMLD